MQQQQPVDTGAGNEQASSLHRKPGHVIVSPLDLWAIQKGVKINTGMVKPGTWEPMFPPTNMGNYVMHTAWKLRTKVNALFLRMADEGERELYLQLDFDECWFIDHILSKDSYQGAGKFLVQVYRCLWEWENRISVRTHEDGGDRQFNLNELVEYISSSGDIGWFPLEGPEGNGGTLL